MNTTDDYIPTWAKAMMELCLGTGSSIAPSLVPLVRESRRDVGHVEFVYNTRVFDGTGRTADLQLAVGSAMHGEPRYVDVYDVAGRLLGRIPAPYA